MSGLRLFQWAETGTFMNLSGFPQTSTHVPFADVIEKGHDHALSYALGSFVYAVQIRAGRLAGKDAVASKDGARAGRIHT
jgi:hypothetical protein